jgi:hypothetical protein
MKNVNYLLKFLLPAMALGTAWAIRGQFGHEQGAAWAGGIGALSILLLAKRRDWYNRFIPATFAAAIGWGIGGMMSYGQLVGYGKGTDFGNVYYGFLMLFIVGGLYGLIGGGFFGLTLADNEKNRVNWAFLLVEITAGALIVYGFLVNQLGWLMTPPRSELWAACLGMGFALIWHLVRHRQKAALRVAVFAGLGGGFGFAFGDFLQVLGIVSGIKFNFWNVMEYSLGFFGGLGMAYGTFTSQWPEPESRVESNRNYLVPLLFVVLIIPFIVWQQSFELNRLKETFGRIQSGDINFIALEIRIIAISLILVFAVLSLIWYNRKGNIEIQAKSVTAFFAGYFGLYILMSWLITGAVMSLYRIEQYLYLVNFAIILYFLPQMKPDFNFKSVNTMKWVFGFLIVLALIGFLALIAIQTHDELPGTRVRFE